MLHEQVRTARIKAGLTQAELARRAGIPRKQLVMLEQGSNITLATLRKVTSQLPDLKSVALGGLQIGLSPELEAVRNDAAELYAIARRLLDRLGSPPSESGGAVRYAPGITVDPELGDRLERIVIDLRRTPVVPKDDA